MKYVIYYRVSTQRQGVSGLGLEAQKAQVTSYLNSRHDVEVVGEYVEIVSGRKTNRDQLNKAIAQVKREKAVLLVAKLDRLSRNVRFFLELLDTIKIEFADLPSLESGTSNTRLLLTQLASFAEWESSRISERTKQALQAKLARGELMGVKGKENIKFTNGRRKVQADQFARQIAPIIRPLVGTMPQRQILAHLNNNGVKSPTGGRWHLSTLQNVIKRIN